MNESLAFLSQFGEQIINPKVKFKGEKKFAEALHESDEFYSIVNSSNQCEAMDIKIKNRISFAIKFYKQIFRFVNQIRFFLFAPESLWCNYYIDATHTHMHWIPSDSMEVVVPVVWAWVLGICIYILASIRTHIHIYLLPTWILVIQTERKTMEKEYVCCVFAILNAMSLSFCHSFSLAQCMTICTTFNWIIKC